jgi:hypothetical protein
MHCAGKAAATSNTLRHRVQLLAIFCSDALEIGSVLALFRGRRAGDVVRRRAGPLAGTAGPRTIRNENSLVYQNSATALCGE